MNGYILTRQKTEPVTTVSDQVLTKNDFRKYLFIQNQGTDKIFVQLRDVQTGNTGFILLPGSSYEPILVPVQSIYIIANSGTQNVFIIEGSEV